MDSVIGAVPDGWHSVPLSEVCDIRSGIHWNALKKATTADEGLALISPGMISNDQISVADARRVNLESEKQREKYGFRLGDVAIIRVGKTIRHAQIGPSHLPSLIGSSCKALRPHEDLVSAYLNCYLRHPAIGDWFEQHVRRGIVAILNDSILGELPVVLPPLEVQHEIGEIDSSFDQKIHVHERIATTTRALRDSLVPELLVGSMAAGPRTRKKSR